jgi:hypothetical protein
VLKWTGVGVCAALLAACKLSTWGSGGVLYVGSGDAIALYLTTGRLVATRTDRAQIDQSLSPGWHYAVASGSMDAFGWRWFIPEVVEDGLPGSVSTRFILVPVLAPFTLLALPTAWLFYRDRRSVRWSREGRCVGCGYDLSGVSGKCPECGRESPV